MGNWITAKVTTILTAVACVLLYFLSKIKIEIEFLIILLIIAFTSWGLFYPTSGGMTLLCLDCTKCFYDGAAENNKYLFCLVISCANNAVDELLPKFQQEAPDRI